MPSISSFRDAAIANPSATLRYEGGGHIGERQIAAPKNFLGRSVSFLRGSPSSGTMKRFKAALAQEHGAGSAKMMEKAVSTAKQELATLNIDYNSAGYPNKGRKGNLDSPSVTEIRRRLTAVINAADIGKSDKLTSKTVQNADRLTGILATHKDDPMLKMMGPTKFLGYLIAAEARITDGDDEVQAAAALMSAPEKVALYGYTCADYAIINPSLWNPKPDTDPGIKAYCDHATSALLKAPLAKSPEPSGRVTTERSFNNPAGQDTWAQDRYGNKTVVEAGFFSTAASNSTKSTFTASVVSAGGGRDVSGFSAWHIEKEVLYPPGTFFESKTDPNKANHFVMTEVQPLTKDATKAFLSQMVGKAIDAKVARDLGGRIEFDRLDRITENDGLQQLTQTEVDRLLSGVVPSPLTEDETQEFFSQMAGKAIDPKVAGEFSGKVEFDSLNRIINIEMQRLKQPDADRLLKAVVSPPLTQDATKAFFVQMTGKAIDPRVVSEFGGRIEFDFLNRITDSQKLGQLTQAEADRLQGGIVQQPLTPDETRVLLTQLAGKAVDPKIASSLADQVAFDYLGRVQGTQTLQQMTRADADRLLNAVVKDPTLANSGGERMLRTEREIIIDFISRLAKAQGSADDNGKRVINQTVTMMKELWLGSGLNVVSAKAALLAAQADLAGVAPDLVTTAIDLGKEVDRRAGPADSKPIALYHDNILGRRFESELVQALVKSPPPSTIDAARKVGAFVRDNVLGACTLVPGKQIDQPAPQFGGRDLDPLMLKSTFDNLILALVDDARPWHAETPEINTFIEAVKTAKPMQDQVDAFAAMMTKTDTGFDVMKQSFLAVKVSTNLRKSNDSAMAAIFTKSIAPWVVPSTANYKAIVVPARTISPAVGGTGLVNAPGAVAAQTNSFGTILPHQPAMRADVGTPANWGSGRNIPATVHTDLTKDVTDFERGALLNNQSNVNGASGSTSIMTYLFRTMQASGVQLSIDDAFAGTMMFLTFDGGHSLPESTGVFTSIMATSAHAPDDEVGNDDLFEERKAILANHTTSYGQLHDYFASPDTRDAVKTAVETAFTRVQGFFDEVNAERLAAS